ncbi:rhomboid family intramembrane serine protease [Chryseobacterium sp. MFBS3-17]|uniref:rhomboid family intramembrane serine protease n=1 Tax=Chryseobacterium sp. MFBS3-17 TaxID=2886689 RepID=UPI001D0EAEAC|nr:rhomboid family intramembrane serine protease [Chryseobacterium sp. MFBS3-17]MCC2590451.1 rhomboid family intramembrane serine protease [Chryseobacterium sp. MFBS3-17]
MFRNITPLVKSLIIINVLVFVASFLVFPNLMYYLAAYYPQSKSFKIWQVITHMFAHGGWMHLLFNMFTLLSFGPVLEKVLGERKFITFYLVCGLGSFVIYNVWNYFLIQEAAQALVSMNINPAEIFANADFFRFNEQYYYGLSAPEQHLFNLLTTPMLGASGAIFGVVTAFALLFPNAELIFMFIPFPVKAKYLLPLIIAGSLFLGFRQFEGDNIAHFAHLGGALIGYLWIKNWKKKQNNFNRF